MSATVPAAQKVFHIRTAVPDDTVSMIETLVPTSTANSVPRPWLQDAIIQLILDLATYEKEPESAKATPELIRKNVFEKQYASTLMAVAGTPEQPGEALGFALYFFNFSTWTGRPGLFLEDLYVSPASRNMGIGKALFGHLGRIAQEKGCARLDWNVLKWNAPSIAFYEKVLGAITMSEWQGMRLEEAGIDNLKKYAQ